MPHGQGQTKALSLFREIEPRGEVLVITDHPRPAVEIRPYKPIESRAVAPLQALRSCVSHVDDPLDPARHPRAVLVGEWRPSQPLSLAALAGLEDRDQTLLVSAVSCLELAMLVQRVASA